MTRIKFDEKIKSNPFVYYDYYIQDTDTPEIIASKLYGSPTKHWIIMLMNDIYDYQYDWVMSINDFTSYVDNKYMEFADIKSPGNGLQWAKTNVKSYYKIESCKNESGTTTTKEYEITKEEYDTLLEYANKRVVLADNNVVYLTLSKRYVSFYNYENDKNEEKRIIKLVKPEYVAYIESEVKNTL